LKICIVCPYGIDFPGGVWNHISNLSNQLKIKKIDHLIITPESKNKPRSYDNIYQIGKPYNIKSGGSIAPITLSPFISNKVKNILNTYNPDIVHIHEPFAGSLPMFFLNHSKSKIVTTFHSNNGTQLYRFGLSKLFNILGKKIDERIVVSESAEKYIKKHFKQKYTIIPNGINSELYKTNLIKTKKKSNKLKILFIGREDKRKGLKYLMNALKNNNFNFPVKLTIIGHKLSPQNIGNIEIVNPGVVDEQSKINLLQDSDILCAPSLGNESFGIILLEAMVSSTVIIASNIEGYNSVVTNNENGLLIHPRNPKEIFEAINTVYFNKNLKEKIKANGLKFAKEYDWNIISDRIIDIYLKSKNKSN
jgi:phosphatidylinositol alpha-mannosyltransferase